MTSPSADQPSFTAPERWMVVRASRTVPGGWFVVRAGLTERQARDQAAGYVRPHQAMSERELTALRVAAIAQQAGS